MQASNTRPSEGLYYLYSFTLSDEREEGTERCEQPNCERDITRIISLTCYQGPFSSLICEDLSPRANHPLKGDHVRSQASMPKCKFAECAVGDYLAIKSRMRHKVKGSDVTRDTRAEHA